MKEMTQSNLLAAFAGESQAHVKYLNFAERARRENLPNIARLFEAAAYAEQVHASNHLRALEGIHNTVENLAAAIEGETFEFEAMYPSYMVVAESMGEKLALRSMNWANEAEKVHAKLYSEAKQLAEAKKDATETAIWVCTACGYTFEGEEPDVCPICGAKHGTFRKF